MSTLRPIRNKALNYIAAVIHAEWGERCARFEAGCSSCIAWAAFDMVEKITDGSSLDEEQEYAEVKDRFNLPDLGARSAAAEVDTEATSTPK